MKHPFFIDAGYSETAVAWVRRTISENRPRPPVHLRERESSQLPCRNVLRIPAQEPYKPRHALSFPGERVHATKMIVSSRCRVETLSCSLGRLRPGNRVDLFIQFADQKAWVRPRPPAAKNKIQLFRTFNRLKRHALAGWDFFLESQLRPKGHSADFCDSHA